MKYIVFIITIVTGSILATAINVSCIQADVRKIREHIEKTLKEKN